MCVCVCKNLCSADLKGHLRGEVQVGEYCVIKIVFWKNGMSKCRVEPADWVSVMDFSEH